MRALQLTATEGPAALALVQVDEPEVSADEVLLDVRAAGVSYADLLMTRGRYQVRPELPFVPGLEVAGVVRAAPPGLPVEAGQRVAAHLFGGAFAEVAVSAPARTVPIPDGMDLAVAAGFMLNYQTAYFALQRRARLRAGDTVVVHGAGGGVGTAAVAVAGALGATVVAVAGGDVKQGAARVVGAQVVVDPGDDWVHAVRETTNGRGADVVVDPVGGERFDDSIRCLAPEGRVVVVGFTSGEIPKAPANRLLLRNVSIIGAAWREFLDVAPGYAQEAAAELNRLYTDGRLRVPAPTRYPLAQGAQALRDLEARRAAGKLVVEI